MDQAEAHEDCSPQSLCSVLVPACDPRLPVQSEGDQALNNVAVRSDTRSADAAFADYGADAVHSLIINATHMGNMTRYINDPRNFGGEL